MARSVSSSRRLRARLLSLAPAPHQAQERQYRRFLPALGQRLPLHDRARGRQRHGRRMPDHIGATVRGEPDRGHHSDRPMGQGKSPARARVQQFATRVYGPLFTAGLHFWQLGESHYWGHNAIIRLAPFLRHCALARLPGRGALSGEILSHDSVKAALMSRAGWAVWIAYDLEGSYEEMPPNLVDELKRDRRWCQGNLMNFRLFLMKGLHPAHRAVFMTGVMTYLSAPLWFLFLIL